MVTLFAAIEDASSVGDTSGGRGVGPRGYKGRLREAEELVWITLVPTLALTSPRAWVGVAPGIVTNAARAVVPDRAKQRLRTLTRRGAGAAREEQP